MSIGGLAQAGAWNYLREEITVALECRRCTRISIYFDFDPSREYSDSTRANIASFILAKVINYSFRETPRRRDDDTERSATWQSLFRELKAWKECLPQHFEPFSNAAKADSPFPSLWLLQPWHGKCPRLLWYWLLTNISTVAAMQYYHVANLLLYLFDPQPHDHTAVILESSLEVCGLADTNNNVSARVNAFGPLAFCR